MYAVWVPVQHGAEKDVSEATATLPDERVRHFWDGEGFTLGAFSPVLGLPAGPAGLAVRAGLLVAHLDDAVAGVVGVALHHLVDQLAPARHVGAGVEVVLGQGRLLLRRRLAGEEQPLQRGDGFGDVSFLLV